MTTGKPCQGWPGSYIDKLDKVLDCREIPDLQFHKQLAQMLARAFILESERGIGFESLNDIV